MFRDLTYHHIYPELREDEPYKANQVLQLPLIEKGISLWKSTGIPFTYNCLFIIIILFIIGPFKRFELY